MKKITLIATAATLALAGCADMQQRTGVDGKAIGAVGGAAIGCLSGALLAKVTGQNATGGCVAGAVVGGLVGFEKARQEEISAASKAQQEAIAALAPLASSTQVKAGEIKTVEVTATDKTKNESRKYQAFDSVSIDIPLSAKGTPEYDAALSKLKTLAEKVADERGSSRIDIAMTAADAKANKVTLETASVKTAKGNTVTVSKAADKSVQKGVERVTVRAGKLEQTVVS
jgi:hypothetical protein